MKVLVHIVLCLSLAFPLPAFAGQEDGTPPKKRKLKNYKTIKATDTVTAEQVKTLEWEETLVKPSQKTLVHTWDNLLQNHVRTKNVAILKAIHKDRKRPRPQKIYEKTYVTSELVISTQGLGSQDMLIIVGKNKDGKVVMTQKTSPMAKTTRIALRNPNAWGDEKAVDKIEVYVETKIDYYRKFQYHSHLESKAQVPGLRRSLKNTLKRDGAFPESYCAYDAKAALGDLNTQILEVSTPLKDYTDREKALSELSPEEQRKLIKLYEELDALKEQYTGEEALPSDEYLSPEEKALIQTLAQQAIESQNHLDEITRKLEELQRIDPKSFQNGDEYQKLLEEFAATKKLLEKQITELQDAIKKLETKNTELEKVDVKVLLSPTQLAKLNANQAVIDTQNRQVDAIQAQIDAIKSENAELWRVIDENAFIKEPPPEDAAFLFDVSGSMEGKPYSGMIFTIEYALYLAMGGTKVSVGRMFNPSSWIDVISRLEREIPTLQDQIRTAEEQLKAEEVKLPFLERQLNDLKNLKPTTSEAKDQKKYDLENMKSSIEGQKYTIENRREAVKRAKDRHDDAQKRLKEAKENLIKDQDAQWDANFVYKNTPTEQLALPNVYSTLMAQFAGGSDDPHEGLRTILKNTEAKDVYVFGDGVFDGAAGSAGYRDLIAEAKAREIKVHFICVNCGDLEVFRAVPEETGGTISTVDVEKLNPDQARKNLLAIRGSLQKIAIMQKKIRELQKVSKPLEEENKKILADGEKIRVENIGKNKSEIGKIQAEINQISGDIDRLVREKGPSGAAQTLKDKAIKKQTDAQSEERTKGQNLGSEKEGLHQKGRTQKQGQLGQTQEKIDDKQGEIDAALIKPSPTPSPKPVRKKRK